MLHLRLRATTQRTESIDTLYSEVAQNWTLWCKGNCLPLRGRLHRQRLAGELPENLRMKNPSPDLGVASAQPHDAHRSPLASSSGHFEWTILAPG
jgi:hypothetical protein